MARIKPSEKKPDGKAITPKPIPAPTPLSISVSKQAVKVKPQATTTPTKASEPTPTLKKTAEQPKRRTLQDRRPALKELQEPAERKIVTKPIYSEEAGVVTKTISETKEVVPKPEQRSTARPARSKSGVILGKGTRTKQIEEARGQQVRAIEDAQAAYTMRQREDTAIARGFEQKKREQEEASYRLSLDTQGRYMRKR